MSQTAAAVPIDWNARWEEALRFHLRWIDSIARTSIDHDPELPCPQTPTCPLCEIRGIVAEVLAHPPKRAN